MQLVRPGPEHLAHYVAALERGWSADNERGVEATREELSRIHADAAAFLAGMEDREARVLPSLFQTVQRLSASRASGAGSGTANSAVASGMRIQHYASYFLKPRESAFPTWRSPLIRTTSRHSASSKRMEASWSSTSSSRSSSAASRACAFASRSHDVA